MPRFQDLLKFLLWALFGCSAILLTIKTIHFADNINFFIDELCNCQAAYNFITKGSYTCNILSNPFDPGITSGIMVSWISGVIFALNGNLFVARLATSFFIILQLFFLNYVFLKNKDTNIEEYFMFSFFGIFFLFHLPYWFGFMQSLGELQGALLIGWGLLSYQKKPALAFIFWGMAVWLCKFIYLPLALFLGGAHCVSKKGSIVTKLNASFKFVIFFLSPFFFWLLIIYIQHDLNFVANWWIIKFFNQVFGQKSGLTPSNSLTFIERLTKLEWGNWKRIDQVTSILLIFVPVVISPFVIIKKIFNNKQLEAFLLAGANLSLIIYAFWYFFQSAKMWARHSQPGLYLGFGICIYLLFCIFKNYRDKKKFILLILFISIFTWESFSLKKHFPITNSSPTYARTCSDLFSSSCRGK